MGTSLKIWPILCKYVNTGVFHCNVLAPFLFIIIINYLIEKAAQDIDFGVVTYSRQSRRHSVKTFINLDFADDIASGSYLSQVHRLDLLEQLLQRNISRLFTILSHHSKYMDIEWSMYPTLNTLDPWEHLVTMCPYVPTNAIKRQMATEDKLLIIHGEASKGWKKKNDLNPDKIVSLAAYICIAELEKICSRNVQSRLMMATLY